MNILFLDCALSTGFASLWKGVVESGSVKITLERGESSGMRFLRFRRWLMEMLVNSQGEALYDLVAYEQSHHRGGPATHLAENWIGRVEEECARLGIQYTSVHTGMLKRHASGRGNASKEEMVEAARLRWPDQVVESEDQADALCGLAWAIERYEPK